MDITGPATPVRGTTVFVESLTSYRGWWGKWGRGKSRANSVEVIRRPDWLSAQLRSALAKSPPPVYGKVLIQTPSLDFVTLNSALLVGVGPIVWSDPKHPKPSGALEMVTYECNGVDVDGTRAVMGMYNWWVLNSPA
jgi:hypothetical protein